MLLGRSERSRRRVSGAAAGNSGQCGRRRLRRGLGTTMVVGVVGLVGFQLMAVPAYASVAPPVQPGGASADGTLAGLVVQTGGAPFNVNIGEASSAYQGNETQAKSATVDLGGLGYILANLPVCGRTIFPLSAQPHPLTMDSAAATGSQTSSGNVSGLGTEAVSVSTSPEFATATTVPISLSIESLLEVTGDAVTTVRYLPQGEQEADTSVSENLSLAGGLVTIDGLTWTASAHSGTTRSSTAGFSLGRVSIDNLGLPWTLPSTDSAATAVGAINKALGVFGLSLTLPAASQNSAAGEVSMGPLGVDFAGSGPDQIVVGPLAKLVQALESAIKGVSTNGSDCSQIENLIGNLANPGDTVVNLVMGIASGSGNLQINLGGASASTQAAPNFVDPFSVGGSTRETPLPPGSPSTSVQTPSGGVGSGAVSSTVTSAPPPSSGPAPAEVLPTRAGESQPRTAGITPAAVVRCVTTSPSGGPGCWKGLGTLAGAATLIAGGGLLAADVSYGRPRAPRRRRRRPMSTGKGEYT